MTTYFITRHMGAVDWAVSNKVMFDVHLTHLLSLDELQAGDTIIGTLPINIVAQINAVGVRYVHLSLQIPPHLRGVELSQEMLDECGASLEEFVVERRGTYPPNELLSHQ